MNFRDYYLNIESLLKEFPLIMHFSVDFDEITDYVGSVKGKLELTNGSILFQIMFMTKIGCILLLP